MFLLACWQDWQVTVNTPWWGLLYTSWVKIITSHSRVINTGGTCIGQHQRKAQALQSLPAAPGLCFTRASRQVSLPLSHSHCHFRYVMYQPLIQPKTPHSICCTPPLLMLHLSVCSCMWQYPSTAKPSGKCLLCTGELCKFLVFFQAKGLVSSLFIPASSSLWYYFSNSSGKICFVPSAPCTTALGKIEDFNSDNVIPVDRYLFSSLPSQKQVTWCLVQQ